MAARQPLGDITNKVATCKKRLVDGTVKTYTSLRRPRKTIDVYFESDESKKLFEKKMLLVKNKLKCDNNEALLSKLLDVALQDTSDVPQEDTCTTEDPYFLCSKKKIFELINQCNNASPSTAVGYEQDYHVAVVTLCSTKGGLMTWTSSPPLKDNYEINHRMVHASLCAGLRAVQYESLCKFSAIGMTTAYFRNKVIQLYHTAVDNVKQRSISASMDVEIQSSDESKIKIVTDARHACRKNSYHTDVVAIGYTTNRVVHYEHVTKDDERCSQKHEVLGSRRMYDSFNARNIKVFMNLINLRYVTITIEIMYTHHWNMHQA